MKYLLLALIFCFFVPKGYSCLCYPTKTFCEYSKDVMSSDDGLIFSGSLVARDSLENGMIAYHIEVNDVFHGAIIEDETLDYTSTSDQVVIIAGNESYCLREFSFGKFLFAIVFEQDYGYSLTYCHNNFYKIDSLNTISGYFEDAGYESKLPIADVPNLINGNCNITNDRFSIKMKNVVRFAQNPISNVLSLRNYSFIDGVNYVLYDTSGKKYFKDELSHGRVELDISLIPAGLYFISFYKGPHIYTTRLVKQNE